jgi:dihydroflavonol-4-reductase
MRIFVTGGTGLLGNTILRQLSESGHELVALVRGVPNSDSKVFAGIETEFASGDLADQSAIESAVAQCDAVIHSAGLIHVGWKRLDESMQVNRDGTRTIVDACRKYSRKLVHVGTVDTLGIGTRDQPADESTPLDNAGGQVQCSYVISKRAGVEEVLSGVNQGLRAVIVHPGFMLGPWDWKPSSGRMMLEVGRGWKPIAPSGGCSLCDSRDVAAATINAIDADVESGRQYVLAGENLSYRDLWAAMAKRMGTRPPVMPAGPAQKWIGAVAGDLWSMIAEEGDLNSAGVKMSSMFHYYDSSRARAELGYQNRPSSESLDASADWIRDHHQ